MTLGAGEEGAEDDGERALTSDATALLSGDEEEAEEEVGEGVAVASGPCGFSGSDMLLCGLAFAPKRRASPSPLALWGRWIQTCDRGGELRCGKGAQGLLDAFCSCKGEEGRECCVAVLLLLVDVFDFVFDEGPRGKGRKDVSNAGS